MEILFLTTDNKYPQDTVRKSYDQISSNALGHNQQDYLFVHNWKNELYVNVCLYNLPSIATNYNLEMAFIYTVGPTYMLYVMSPCKQAGAGCTTAG